MFVLAGFLRKGLKAPIKIIVYTCKIVILPLVGMGVGLVCIMACWTIIKHCFHTKVIIIIIIIHATF